jgi:MFS family permease
VNRPETRREPDDSMTDTAAPRTGWASLLELNRYHWFVFAVAALGWLADCFDQQLFNLARKAAVTELLAPPPADDPRLTAEAARLNVSLTDPAIASYASRLRLGDINRAAGFATSVFLVGWAVGGIVFGVLGDRWGRVKTMVVTILMYSVFTGLSALSISTTDFAVYRFLTGLGVGGEFAVGVALLAETMPDRARPYTLGLLQASSAVGNTVAALLYIGMGTLEQGGTFQSWTIAGRPVTAWRLLFVIGVIPALLAVLVRRRLKEPERWKQAARSDRDELGSYRALFREPRWRRNALFGLLLAFAGVVGLWGIGFFSIDLIQTALRKTFVAEGYAGPALEGQLKVWAGITSLMLQVGGFFGMFAFSWATAHIGRRPAFAFTFLFAAASTAFVFLNLRERSDIYWMLPVMGFFQFAIFGGYAIYFPELFPTRLRSTGTSFCYNVGRLVAAAGPAALGVLTSEVFAGYGHSDPSLPQRYAGVAMCSVFLLGLVALPFLPETRNQPLPE